MPKIRIDCDSRYPDYCITSSPWLHEVEVSDENLALIRKAEEDYKKAQELLEELYNRDIQACLNAKK